MISPATRSLLLLLVALLTLSVGASSQGVPTHLNEATVAQLQAAMTAGTLTSEALTKYYIARIIGLDQNGPGVNSVSTASCLDPCTESRYCSKAM
jgi:amidase